MTLERIEDLIKAARYNLEKMRQVSESTGLISYPTWVKVHTRDGKVTSLEMCVDDQRPEWFTDDVMISDN